jgi:hypothetical protein
MIVLHVNAKDGGFAFDPSWVETIGVLDERLVEEGRPSLRHRLIAAVGAV